LVTGAKQEPAPGALAEENPGKSPGAPFLKLSFLASFLAVFPDLAARLPIF